jgi:asparagine synthase (glutamine-hydrolysing)
MCGIAGIVDLGPAAAPPALEDLHAMLAALRHRGPDEFGIYRDRTVGLAHARLSIIDLAHGQQPLCNEDGTLWVIFNGEIFNYVELRQELRALGHAFRTESDTEVIVHAFEAWGEAAFARFNGQFAIALWDARQERLTLARDRLGVRPLHLCQRGRRVYFASEVKAIFAADPAIPRAFDPVGLAETFTFWTVVPPQTPFAGVTEVEPGHVVTWSAGGRVDREYWAPRFPLASSRAASPQSIADAARWVRDALEEAVRLRMLRSDVPVGCYLSGGLDSSVVAALGLRAKGSRFKTFSVRFEDPEYDEGPYQRALADHIGSEHRELLVTRRDIAEAFPEVVRHAERPLLRAGPAPLYLLSRLVRDEGVKVVLTGEGADELFAGYDLFREGRVRRFWGRRPESTCRPRLLERLYPYLGRSPLAQRALAREFFGQGRERWREAGFAHQTRWRAASALQRLFRPELRARSGEVDVERRLLSSLPQDFSHWTYLAQDQYLEVRTLLSGYLLSSQGDRMLMAHSVEGRFPFLDPTVVELANALPAGAKLRGLDEKHVLKRAAADLIPGEILRRPKQPYRAPDALSFVEAGGPEWVAEVLSDRAVARAGVFDPAAVTRLWRKCLSAGGGAQFSNADNMGLVGVLSTGLLHEELIERAPARGTVRCRTLIDRLPGAAGGSAMDTGERRKMA